MSAYTESGIRVDLSDKAHHCFEALPTYIYLKGQCVKEMDLCWLEPAVTNAETGTQSPEVLICLELKGYQETALTVDYLLENLEQKAKDTLLMLCAAWLDRGKGKDLALELPEAYRTYNPTRRIRLIMLIDADNSQAQALTALKDKLRNRLRGMTHLLDFKLTLVNCTTAMKIGLPVSPENTAE